MFARAVSKLSGVKRFQYRPVFVTVFGKESSLLSKTQHTSFTHVSKFHTSQLNKPYNNFLTNHLKLKYLSRIETRSVKSNSNKQNLRELQQFQFLSRLSNYNNSSLNLKSLGIFVGTAFVFGTKFIFDICSDGFGSINPYSVYADHNNRHNFIADVVEKAAPAVVFLEIKGGNNITLSNGSGFVVRSNGLILTNAHVVANKSLVSVKLQDGSFYEGHVTAVDPITDLATIKIEANNLTTVKLGKSSEIRPGEWVIAMGSPLSLSNTVTCGIVSSVQRASKELGLRNKDMDYIQTDAVINFGNSGGPLVDLDGHAIGINTMKVTTGISFAIPADYAQTFLEKAEAMMSKGRVDNGFSKRRYIGVTMLTLNEKVMQDLKSNRNVQNFPDVSGGVFVYKVIPGTPAHIGGILAGDIIIEISGTTVKSAADVYDSIEKGQNLELVVIRGMKKNCTSKDGDCMTKKKIRINTKETI